MNAALTPHEQTYEERATLLASLDAFTTAYLECALWASTESDEEGNMGDSLDENHDLESFDLESLQAAIADCKAFQEENADDLADLDPEQCGHDFWLTRCRHGAGFWDRGLGAVGDRLSEAARVYGDVDLMAWEGVVSGH